MNTVRNISQTNIFKTSKLPASDKSKIIRVSVVFGNPKCNCENYGICKISEGFDLYNRLEHSNKVKAIITYKHTNANISILLKSISSDSKEYHFKNFSFNVISKYTLANTIIKTSNSVSLFIKPGIYTYSCKYIFRMPIEIETNYAII